MNNSKRKKPIRYALMVSAALLFAIPFAAIADDASNAGEENKESNIIEDSKEEKETIIVVGQRDTPISVVPRGLSISLNKADFESVNAINVEDLMKYTPNFFVRKRFAGDDNAVVALRGVNTTQSARVIVMVDGFLVSNFLGNTFSTSPKWNVVGPAEVRQFDVVYGPYSARYGGNSMGGIISITTQEPKQNGGYLNVLTNIMPYKEYGFDETFKGYNIEGGYNYKSKDDKFSARVSFRHFDNIGQSMSFNLLVPTSGTGSNITGAYSDPRLTGPVFGAASPVDVVQDQLRGRIGFKINENWDFDLLAMAWLTDQNLLDPRVFIKDSAGNPFTNTGKVVFEGKTYNAAATTFSRFEREEYLVGAKLYGRIGETELRANLSQFRIPKFETYKSSNWANGVANGAGTFNEDKNPNWWALDIGLNKEAGRHRLAYGVNGNIYSTEQENFAVMNWNEASNKTFTSASGGKTTTIGAYFEDEIDIGFAILSLGGRIDNWRAHDGYLATVVGGNKLIKKYDTRTETSFSPKASLQAEIAPELFAQLSVGKATRFPTVGELFQAKFLSNSGDIDPKSFDPNLKPEVSTDISFMLRKNFKNLRLTSSFYYQNIEDALVSFTASAPNEFGVYLSGYQNIDIVSQYGVELILEVKDFLVKGLNLDLSATRMESIIDRNTKNPSMEGISNPRIPNWRSSGNITYPFTSKLKANIGWRYASRPNSDLFGLRRGDAFSYQSEYFFVDTRINYKLNDKISFGFGVDNINDDHAYVFHPLPQKTYVFDVKYNW